MTGTRYHRPAWARSAALWLPGLLVALGAGVATAHGLYEVALGAGVPQPIAWLYPLITDGLALVAYATTARLTDGARTYAWAVVVLAAGLSGLAQASYLSGGVDSAPTALRFGVGAWPAIAAAIVAHVLFLLGSQAKPFLPAASDTTAVGGTAAPLQGDPAPPAVQRPVQAVVHSPVQPDEQQSKAGHLDDSGVRRTTGKATPSRRTSKPPSEGAPRERARTAARRHATQHGALPTVSQLMDLADVARGTAGNALKELREHSTQLHVVNDGTPARADQ
jgi:hypothetical protein